MLKTHGHKVVFNMTAKISLTGIAQAFQSFLSRNIDRGCYYHIIMRIRSFRGVMPPLLRFVAFLATNKSTRHA